MVYQNNLLLLWAVQATTPRGVFNGRHTIYKKKLKFENLPNILQIVWLTLTKRFGVVSPSANIKLCD